MTDQIRKKAIYRFAQEAKKEEGPRNDNLFDVDEVACIQCNEVHHVMPEKSNEFPKDQWCYNCSDLVEFTKEGEIRYE